MAKAECRRVVLYSSIQAATRARVRALVAWHLPGCHLRLPNPAQGRREWMAVHHLGLVDGFVSSRAG